jgi:type II secretory pathway pseudopilin PulG
MRTRSGITLVEVLVAIFIMGVGLLAILVLFPLGALNMARAIRDDRAMQCAAQAEVIANLWDLRHDPAVNLALVNPTNQGDQPAVPAYIDPFGAPSFPTIGQGGNAFPRVSPTGIPAGSATLGERWFTLPDDLVFNPDGSPAGTPGVSVQRTGSYTWTYIARRPQAGQMNPTDLTVLVFKGRNPYVPDPEPFFVVNANAGSNSLSLTVTPGQEPELRSLGYILDLSLVNGVPVARTYQVTDIQKANTVWTLRVEPPLRNAVNAVVVLENCIGVFEKSIGWQP